MQKQRKFIKNVLDLTGRVILGGLVFFISIKSVPALQAFWEDSGIIDAAFNTAAGGSRFHTQKYAVIGDSVIELEIVTSAGDRARGLSGRSNLPNNTGMWFVFNSDDYHGIWMKDMNFSIDIIWVDSFMKIVHIEENVSPDTYPHVFKPNITSRYVLEVPAGYVQRSGIKISDQIDLF